MSIVLFYKWDNNVTNNYIVNNSENKSHSQNWELEA